MTCKTCKHAKWQYDKAGRIIWPSWGECTVPYDMVDAPWCVQAAVGFRSNPPRNAIWTGTGEGCPKYEERRGGDD